ncbi:MAG: hypothetical protein AAF748_05270 [Pseudomonadota bacterium]
MRFLTSIALISATASVAVAQGACHSSYVGVCVPANVSDVDCASGSGNGPYYVSGPIRVVGPDVYDLDRDNDGIGCERG